jgi:predicted dithiol-disulfide oxidoreductase (DUF899 family)
MTTHTKLAPAEELAAKGAARPFPNEPPEYRKAREALLVEEIKLRRQILQVAELRRGLPPGSEPKEYKFLDENGASVTLSDMFGPHDTLVTYFWMYGPQRERPCPMCTSFLGSLDIPARDIEQRVSFVVRGRSPVARQLAFARERGWRNLKFYQCVGDDFARDYRAIGSDDFEGAMLAVWHRQKGKVHLFWTPEASGTQDPGFDPHLAPEIAPLWNILDLTPGGRGTDWYPSLEYTEVPGA